MNSDTALDVRPLKRQRNDVVNSKGFDNSDESTIIAIEELMSTMTEKYSFLNFLLKEFYSEIIQSPTAVFETDASWFWFLELKFLLCTLKHTAYLELAHCSTKPDGVDTCKDQSKRRLVDRAEMMDRLLFLDKLGNYLKDLGEKRLESTKNAGLRLPRIFRLAKLYNLSPSETDLLSLLVVFQGCQSNSVRMHVLADDNQRKFLLFQRLVGISEIDIEDFYDDIRLHVKEGTVLVDEEHFGIELRLSNIAVRVLLGHKLSNNQLLKLSQTALESLLKDEGLLVPSTKSSSKVTKSNGMTKINDSPEVQDGEAGIAMEENEDKAKSSDSTDDDLPIVTSSDAEDDSVSACSFIGASSQDKLRSGRERTSSILLPSLHQYDDEDLRPYSAENQLEYLEDRFQVIAFAIRASGARVKDEMKEAGTKQPWENSAPTSAGRRELKAKQRVQERKVSLRLALTREAEIVMPRLEQMAKKFKLSVFEQNVIVLLIGKTVSPVIKNLIDGVDPSPVRGMDESTTINQILSIFCDNFQDQVLHRVHFYKSSRLVSSGLVKIQCGRWHSTSGDLVDHRVDLDRRVLDWVVGLDTEINELVEGSDLYVPKVKMEHLILPDDHKKTLLEAVESFEGFRAYRKKVGLEEIVSYGAGLVILLCGASGTGKTMTVNAIAHHLKKRVLLVDFPSLQGKKKDGNGDSDADLRGLFREADMSNAILFFDECESIFKQREFGGDRLLNALLVEMERHEGVVFLATNRPFDLDEAMHRRITSVFEFKPPDYIQRKRIWQVLISDKLKVCPDVDWDMISLKYELSGGFIKNAILAALLKAISRDAKNPVITQQDIVAGCSLQMRGSLHMKTFNHRVVPTEGLDGVILEESIKVQLQQIVDLEKARGVIYGQWGFDFGQVKNKQKGVTAMIWGPKGIGKTSVVKAIGFEVGRPLKVVQFSQLDHDNISETRKAIRTVFDDARLMDAVLVIDGFESFGSNFDTNSNDVKLRVEINSLLDLMDSFPGIVILLASIDEYQRSLLHEDFNRRLKFIIQMKMPNAVLRESLWKSMIPPTAPFSPSINFKKLGERYSINSSGISNAVFKAAAKAALRSNNRRIVMSDLEEAADSELKKEKGTSSAMLDRLFV